MSLHTLTTGVRHSNRNITKSRRARESDESIPGLDFRAPERFATPASPSGNYEPFEHQESSGSTLRTDRAHDQDMDTTKSLLSAVGTAVPHLLTPRPSREPSIDTQAATPKSSTPTGDISKRGRGRSRGRGRGSTIRTARKSRGVAKADAATQTPWSTATSKTSPPPPAAAARPSRPRDFLDILSLQIYPWPHPQPADFTNLTKEQETWRSEQAFKEFIEDESADPDLEDWHAISGNPYAYSESTSNWAYGYSVARTFILRAKRARRHDQTWEAFEDTELAIDSMSQARAIEDPEIREVHMQEAVNNDSRLRIFKLIRKRLCLEIWSQPFLLRWNLDLDEEGDVHISRVADEPPETSPEQSAVTQERDNTDDEVSVGGNSIHVKHAYSVSSH